MVILVFVFLFACQAEAFGAERAGSDESSEEQCAAGGGACQETKRVPADVYAMPIKGSGFVQKVLARPGKSIVSEDPPEEEEEEADRVKTTSAIQRSKRRPTKKSVPTEDEHAVPIKGNGFVQKVLASPGKSIVSEDPPEGEEADRVKTTSAIQRSKRRPTKKSVQTEDEYAMTIKGSGFLQSKLSERHQEEELPQTVKSSLSLQVRVSKSRKSIASEDTPEEDDADPSKTSAAIQNSERRPMKKSVPTEDEYAMPIKGNGFVQKVLARPGKSIASEDPPEEEEADRVKTTSAIQNSERRPMKKSVPTEDEYAVPIKGNGFVQKVLARPGKSIVSEDPQEEQEADRVKTTSAIQNSKRRPAKKSVPTEDEYAMPIKGSGLVQSKLAKGHQKEVLPRSMSEP